MLLNLSNHPSVNWPDKQKQTAIELYDTIIDMPFPNIPPQWSREEVDQLADEFVAKIEQSGATVVHIMGELVFTHILVNKLTRIGIPCIASTTERIVEMEGDVKKIKFNFVQFRSY